MVSKSTLLSSNENNKFVNDSNDNVAVNTVAEITNDASNPVPVDPPLAAEPFIYNLTIGAGDIGIEQSQALPNGTKKIFIQHDGRGVIDFAFTPGLTAAVTIPRFANFSDEGLDLQGKTLYLKSDKVGIVQILIWT